MWPEVQTAKEENRRELKLSGSTAQKRFQSNNDQLDEAIFLLKALNLLDINDSPLASISPQIANLENLQSLLLFRNQISAVPAEIGKLSALKVLDLSGNRIETLPEELGQLKSLTTVNLSGNRLKRVDLSGLDRLSVINVSSNLLEEFPLLPEVKANANHIPALSEIILEKNEITEIPDGLQQQLSLKVLNVAGNKIELVPKSLVKCHKLKDINLLGNPLKDKRLKKLVEQCHSKQVLDYIEKNGHVPPKSTAKKSQENDSEASSETTDSPPPVADIRQKLTILKAQDTSLKVTFTAEAKDLRPHLLHCIIRGFSITTMKKFLQLQNDLHDNECGKRELGTIATHDLTKIKGNLLYRADLSDQIEITPLGARGGKITAGKYYEDLRQHAEAIRKEKKRSTFSGIYKFLHLLEGKVFVCFSDDEKVISLPPLTNCEETKISPDTQDMLLEVTSTVSLDQCRRVMSALIKRMLLMDVQITRTASSEGQKKKGPKGKAVVSYDKSKEMTLEQVRLFDADGNFQSVYPGKGDLVFDDGEKIDVEYKD
ncbi:leucine-rich repeat-containing protein 47-like [Uranotaenia lowii]|uniref:leucine-rich repeat-containing protein 47-like n=1 Tax=Uranotaenia lowii TaxID=190385 RepID=UPI0024793CAE|nr:leucine-rich repeat-containing protein 47-like [Uranotaenia lowii]